MDIKTPIASLHPEELRIGYLPQKRVYYYFVGLIVLAAIIYYIIKKHNDRSTKS
jgi:hypothetical protein